MKLIPNSHQGVKRSFLKVNHAMGPGLGGLISFLLINSDTLALPWPDFQGLNITETSMLGWSLFWFTTFVLGGIMGMLLYPLFRFQSPLKTSDLDPKRDKILLIGSGILTALILVTLYLLTQRTLAALTTLPALTPFVIEVRNDLGTRASCSDQPLITPSEIRGSLGEPTILKLIPAGKPALRTSSLNLQPSSQAVTLPSHLTAHQTQQTVHSLCSRCHSDEVQTPGALTFVMSWSTLGAEAGLKTQDHLEVTY